MNNFSVTIARLLVLICPLAPPLSAQQSRILHAWRNVGYGGTAGQQTISYEIQILSTFAPVDAQLSVCDRSYSIQNSQCQAIEANSHAIAEDYTDQALADEMAEIRAGFTCRLQFRSAEPLSDTDCKRFRLYLTRNDGYTRVFKIRKWESGALQQYP